MSLKKLLALLLALAMMAAACGGGDDDEDASDSDDAAESDDSSGDDEAMDEDDGGDTDAVTDPGEPAAEIAVDYGVTDDTIRIGINGDLSGPFAALVSDIVEAQKVYWEVVNDNGGIAGRMVEVVTLDSGYDTATGIENYAELAAESDEGVLMISENTGSPITAALAEDAADDNMLLIPLSWASLWPDPEFGSAVLEKQATYCIESMNGVEWLKQHIEAKGETMQLAIISRPGEYGEDGAVGAELAAEALGIEVVYDGRGLVAGDDRTAIISELVGSGANAVWTTLTPGELLDIFGQAVSQGFEADWSGNSPTFSYPVHLTSDFAEEFSEYYWQSGYAVPWDTEGIAELDRMKEEMAARRPDLNLSDQFLTGWIEGIMVETILRQAAANGDMTREGVVQASTEVGIDFLGLSPNQTYSGDYNTDVVRETYIYDVDSTAFNLLPLSDAVSSGEGGTGLLIEEGPYTGSVAADYQFDGPCIEPSS